MAGGSANLPNPSLALTVGGASKGPSDGVIVDAWGWDYDSDSFVEFREEGAGAGWVPSFHAGQEVTLTVGGTLEFTGDVVSVAAPQFTDVGWTIGYRALGYKHRLNQYPYTATDGTGSAVYNLDAADDDWIPSNSGLTVGDILDLVLTDSASALSACGVAPDATTTSQLAALTLVPADPVVVSGRLGQAIDSVLRAWAKNVVFMLTPAGKVRFLDTTAGTPVTVTEMTDPSMPFRFGYSVEDCATRVVVRGKADVAPFYASVSQGTLVPAWTSPQQSAWSLADYESPRDATDSGAVTTVVGANVVRVQSTDAAKTWASNFWSGRQAWVHLFKSAGSGLTFTESRPVTACTSLSAGGTSDLTLGYDLDNAGASAYDSYRLVGTAGALGSGGYERVDVGRLYNVVTPGNHVEAHLVKRFPTDVAFMGYYGDSTVLTRYPKAVVVSGSGSTFPASFKIVPSTGQIRFDEPVTKPFNSRTNLVTGGSAVTYPSDVWALLAYSRGALTTVYPPDSGGSPVYSGTAYSLFGLQRTAYVEVESWVYKGDAAKLNQYAEMLHTATKDVVWEGTLPVLGYFSAFKDYGTSLNLAGTGYSTGQESLAVPVRGFTVRTVSDGAGGVLMKTFVRCSSRRNPATGDRQYLHPTRLEQLGFKMPSGGLNPAASMSQLYSALSSASTGANFGAILPTPALPTMPAIPVPSMPPQPTIPNLTRPQGVADWNGLF